MGLGAAAGFFEGKPASPEVRTKGWTKVGKLLTSTPRGALTGF